MNNNSIHLYKALESYYKAQRDEALAIMEVYFSNSVGIGEHSNLLNELKEWTCKLSEAEEALEALEKNFANKKP